jgi:hypothetical protein
MTRSATHNQAVKRIFPVGVSTLLVGLCIDLSVLPSPAQGCAMCQAVLPPAGDPLARGMFWSVLFLLSAPFAVGAAIGGWLLYQYWRAAHPHRSESSAAVLHPALTSRKENA